MQDSTDIYVLHRFLQYLSQYMAIERKHQIFSRNIQLTQRMLEKNKYLIQMTLKTFFLIIT